MVTGMNGNEEIMNNGTVGENAVVNNETQGGINYFSDENGNVFYYDENGNAKYVDSTTVLYDENGNAYYADLPADGAKEKQKNSGKKDVKKKEKQPLTKEVVIKNVIIYTLLVVVAFFAAILVNIYVVRRSNVVGDSMLPTYYNGDSVLISKLPYAFGDPDFADVVVFDSEMEPRSFGTEFKETLKYNAVTSNFMEDEELYDRNHKFYIKRVIGVAGDTIKIENGIIYVNDVVLENKGFAVIEPVNYYTPWDGMTWQVEEGQVFVLGDNRGNSTDSRDLGCIPVECILGKVIFD